MNFGRLVPAAALALTLTGCAAFTEDPEPGDVTPGANGTLDVYASFYPLQFLTEKVGGDRVTVSPLTPPGVDPHNLELSPRTVTEMGSASLVVYLSGFQAAVDDAISVAGARSLDAAEHTELRASGDEDADHGDEEDHGHDHAAQGDGDPDGHDDADDHEDDGDGQAGGAGDPDGDGDANGSDGDGNANPAAADGDANADDGHDHGPLDPHFWLDPLRFAQVGEALAAELGELDPDGADTYAQNLADLTGELTALDEELQAGLAECERDTIVVAHEAYGYLTAEHGLRQAGLAGIDPDSDPSPARLAEIAEVVEANDVDTIFVETLASPRVVESLAQDLGVQTAVLDPLENQQDESADYLDVMRANLSALQGALDCEAA